jgi:hypothetical protein
MFDQSIFFKYRSINANTLSSIESGFVWFSNHFQLNDPYDCNPAIISDINDNKVDELLATYGYALKGNTRSREKVEWLEKFLLKYVGKSGVYCVTQNPLNELMWAHYGDGHRGIVVGHKVKQENIDNREYSHRAPRPLKYEGRGQPKMSDYYISSLNKEGADEAFSRLIREIYFSKTSVWSYEEEYRFLSVREYGLKEADAAITVVIYGARTPEHHISLVQKLISGEVSQYRTILTGNGLKILPVNR